MRHRIFVAPQITVKLIAFPFQPVYPILIVSSFNLMSLNSIKIGRKVERKNLFKERSVMIENGNQENYIGTNKFSVV